MRVAFSRVTEAQLLAASIALLVAFQQIHVAFESPLGRALTAVTGTTRAMSALRGLYAPLRRASRAFLGHEPHGLFLDSHFDGYDQLVGVTFQRQGRGATEEWLPLIRSNGQAGPYASGRRWTNWNFRVVGRAPNMQRVRRGLTRYTAFWAGRNGVALDGAVFSIKLKTLKSDFEWSPDLLQRNIASPWREAGTLEWHDGQPTFRFTTIGDDLLRR